MINPCFNCDKLEWCEYPCDKFSQYVKDEKEKKNGKNSGK